MLNKTNFETFNYFFMSLIGSCCFILALPYMSKYPNPLLFSYFFIMISVIALFLNWYFYQDTYSNEVIYYILPSLLFIVISLFGSFLLISSNKQNITYGNVTNYYYRFNLVTIWLILIECYLFYHLYLIINDSENARVIMIMIISFCILNYFTTWSNYIGLKHFSADG